MLSNCRPGSLSDPELAINLANSLIDTLRSLGPSALYNGTQPSALVRDTVDSIFRYAAEIETESSGGDALIIDICIAIAYYFILFYFYLLLVCY